MQAAETLAIASKNSVVTPTHLLPLIAHGGMNMPMWIEKLVWIVTKEGIHLQVIQQGYFSWSGLCYSVKKVLSGSVIKQESMQEADKINSFSNMNGVYQL